jgi:hypothetical protein
VKDAQELVHCHRNSLQFDALLTGVLSRNKRANLVALTILIGVYVYSTVMSFVQPVPL